jgi:hypothetical protein
VLNARFVQGQQLTVQTDAGKQVVLDRSDIEALPHIAAKADGADDPLTFEGVALKCVLEKAGIGFGESLKGSRLAACLIAEAADGYRAVIALPELDPAFTDKRVLLVFLQNGKPLDKKQGPYHIVIPDDKRMGRWVRQVTMLRIVNVP